ncbi:histidine kinase [Marichromatium purpuratum 984]|uniref:histidine kinase n=1 Tax=Marichromatium purpuratum 984 TaxID=765910 RepID=W0DWM3_MARPU|nr:ATP-binding protein [Marichromatium purpuratum]AHF03010.1 histidine kinase [Marichromatium purpuratum 984]
MPLPARNSSLGFQVSAAFVALILLFIAAGLHALGAFQRQLVYDALTDSASRLELAAERMHVQGMNYKRFAPRDYPTYYRDLELYYRDLMDYVATFDNEVGRFRDHAFTDAIPALLPWITPRVGIEVEHAIDRLSEVWDDYRAALFAALGDDLEEPRLEYAAEHSMAAHQQLSNATHALSWALRAWSERTYRAMLTATTVVAVLIALIALLLLVVLQQRVLAPLRTTIDGMRRIAQGDFGYRLSITGSAELRGLTTRFNQLSARLALLQRLIDRLQQGKDLDDLIDGLKDDFKALLGCDWVGVVVIDSTRSGARIETCRIDGARPRTSPRLFRLHGTLLEHALEHGDPLEIDDIPAETAANPEYEFLAHLAAQGMREALLLPLTPQTGAPLPAVVVLARRAPGRLEPEQRGFLGNLAQLMTHSFARTARLAEQQRLATVGEFVAAIAHELRTPISTVAMAFRHLEQQPLAERTRQRVMLGAEETTRMGRLLDDILRYARPLRLELVELDVHALLARFVADYRIAHPQPPLVLETEQQPRLLLGDPDRLRQIFTNLTDNAREASPPDAAIHWRITTNAEDEIVLEVHNQGDPIPEALRARILDPFVSGKPQGTGLGLAIVARLLEQHGAQLAIDSSLAHGTRMRVTFPPLAH